MNWQTWTPPILAVALSAFWISNRKSEVVRVREETVMIQDRLAIARMDAEAESERRKAEAAAHESIDWEEVAGWLSAADRGTMDMRAMMDLQQALLEMELEDILEALDEIQSLDLSKQIKQQLEGMMIRQLINKDPKLALERFVDRIGDPRNGMSWQLSEAFRQWLDDDPAMAMSWYDAELEKGTFDSKSLDGKSEVLNRFEAKALMHLAEHDMAKAGERLALFPEDDRRSLLQQANAFQNKETMVKMVALAREHLPEDDKLGLLGEQVSYYRHQGGLEKVSEILGEIDATDEERAAVADKLFDGMTYDEFFTDGALPADDETFSAEHLDRMRDWVAEQAPEALDRVTGRYLANAVDDDTRDQIVGVLKEYQEAGAGDDLIVSFLEEQGVDDDELVIELGTLIDDDEKRIEVLNSWGIGEEVPSVQIEQEEAP